MIDVRLGHLSEELPGERREAFNVAALPFGKERVKRQRAFAAAGNAGEADELITRESNVDAAQVVLAGAFDDDIGSGHTSV